VIEEKQQFLHIKGLALTYRERERRYTLCLRCKNLWHFAFSYSLSLLIVQ